MRTLLILGIAGALFGALGTLPAEATAAGGGATADTLRYEVRAGQPLLVALPARHRRQPASYRLIEAPALSWLVDRSFYWRTLPSESGTMPVLVGRVAPGVQPDTLVLLVRLTPAGG